MKKLYVKKRKKAMEKFNFKIKTCHIQIRELLYKQKNEND
jgi:hypothetical protein